jgi:hypothetical protein
MRRHQSEAALQRAVCQHLEARAVRGLVWWHCPNGGVRSPIEAAILKGLGVRAGAADLMFLNDGVFYALELKAPKKKPTEEQEEFLHAVYQASGRAAWTDNLDDAIAKLERWGLLRGVAQGRAA